MTKKKKNGLPKCQFQWNLLRSKTMALHLLPIQWELRVSRFFAFASIYWEQYNNSSPKWRTHILRHQIERPTNSSNCEWLVFVYVARYSFVIRCRYVSHPFGSLYFSCVALSWDFLLHCFTIVFFFFSFTFNTNPLVQWHMHMRTLIKMNEIISICELNIWIVVLDVKQT